MLPFCNNPHKNWSLSKTKLAQWAACSPLFKANDGSVEQVILVGLYPTTNKFGFHHENCPSGIWELRLTQRCICWNLKPMAPYELVVAFNYLDCCGRLSNAHSPFNVRESLTC